MKCQMLFSRKNKKTLTSLSSAKLAIESGNGYGDGYISNKCDKQREANMCSLE